MIHDVEIDTSLYHWNKLMFDLDKMKKMDFMRRSTGVSAPPQNVQNVVSINNQNNQNNLAFIGMMQPNFKLNFDPNSIARSIDNVVTNKQQQQNGFINMNGSNHIKSIISISVNLIIPNFHPYHTNYVCIKFRFFFFLCLLFVYK